MDQFRRGDTLGITLFVLPLPNLESMNFCVLQYSSHMWLRNQEANSLITEILGLILVGLKVTPLRRSGGIYYWKNFCNFSQAIKVAVYGNGRGKRSKWNNSQTVSKHRR